MSSTNTPKNIWKISVLLQLLLLLCVGEAYSVKRELLSDILTDTIIAGLPPRSLELDEIRFSGNTFFSDDVLSRIINTRPSELSFTREAVRWYARQLRRNTTTPPPVLRSLDDIQEKTGDQIQYYIPSSVSSDSLAIILFYREHGYHRTAVRHEFYFDPEAKRNVLEFIITENFRSTIEAVRFTGLDGLDERFAKVVERSQKYLVGRNFSQSMITGEADKILRMLRTNGYFYSRYAPPIVTTNPNTATDSITLHFHTGKRQRIQAVNIVRDSTAVTSSFITEKMHYRQLEFKVGDWYNEERIFSSVNNLYSLGTFAVALIDTTSQFVPQTDSTLSLRVFTKMRDVDDINIGLVSNRTPFDNAWNGGVETSYLHRNLGGIGQNINVFASALLRDLNRTLEQGISDAQVEYQLGVRFAQPFLFSMLDRNVGFSAQALFSRQSIALTSPLVIQTINNSFTLPLRLREHTIINNIVFDIAFEQQKPIGLANAFGAAKTNAIIAAGDDPSLPPDELSEQARRNLAITEAQFLPYLILDELNEGLPFYALTSSRFGLNFIGAHRNHPFDPTDGYDINFGVEVAGVLPGFFQGESRYLRLQTLVTYFIPWDKQTVLGFKFRAGHVHPLDGKEGLDDFYVPFDRLFFAGGSNSVRAWQARRLRYLSFSRDIDLDEIERFELNSYTDILGAASIIEGSFEWRWKPFEQTPSPSTLRGQLERTGITFFVDYGNTFNSAIDDQAFRLSIGEMLSNIAVGAGLGLRYDTPVGPVRIDFAARIFDPDERDDRRWVFSGDRPLSFVWQIGIGHAF